MQVRITLFKIFVLLVMLIQLSACNEQTSRINKNKSDVHRNIVVEKSDSGVNAVATGLQVGKSIRSIFQDNAGNIWVGTHGAGVIRYDGKQTIAITENDGLCSDYVGRIQQDKAGKIWFETGDGICCYNGSSFTAFTGHSSSQKVDTVYDWKTSDDDLWFSGNTGAFRYDGNTMRFHPFHEVNGKSFQTGQVTPYTVYSTFKDKDGNVWFGTQASGVARFDGKSFTWFRDNGLAGPAVLAITQDHEGYMWFGNNGAGVFRYDGDSVINFTAANGLSNDRYQKFGAASDQPQTLARIWNIVEDDAGNIWFGTVDAGAWRDDGKTLINFSTKSGLVAGVSAMCKMQDGNLLIGTNAGDLFIVDGTSIRPFNTNGISRSEN